MHVTSEGVLSGTDVYGQPLTGTANEDGSWTVTQANGSTLTWLPDLTDTYTPPAELDRSGGPHADLDAGGPPGWTGTLGPG